MGTYVKGESLQRLMSTDEDISRGINDAIGYNYKDVGIDHNVIMEHVYEVNIKHRNKETEALIEEKNNNQS